MIMVFLTGSFLLYKDGRLGDYGTGGAKDNVLRPKLSSCLQEWREQGQADRAKRDSNKAILEDVRDLLVNHRATPPAPAPVLGTRKGNSKSDTGLRASSWLSSMRVSSMASTLASWMGMERIPHKGDSNEL